MKTATLAAPPPGSSFKQIKASKPPMRLILDIAGLERQGKTHFALTAPGPLAYMQMDPGGDDVLPKLMAIDPGKVWYHSSYYTDVKPGMTVEQIARQVADPIWKRSSQDYEAALTHCRSVVIDTASEWFTCLKLARFGKLTQVMPENYAPVHAEYKRLIRLAYHHNCNVILLHKLKEEYIEGGQTADGKRKAGKKTGKYVRDGWKGTGYEVQMQVTAFRSDGQFMLLVENCRQQPELEGVELDASMGFAGLAQMVYPDSDESDWI